MFFANPLRYWRSVVLILAPLILLPIPLIIQTKAARCAFVLLWMTILWITEAVHLSATALIPVFAFPLLGVLSTKDVSLSYMKDTNMLFLGGLAMAAAVEHSGLHERVSLFILRRIGTSMDRLLLGFMLTVMLLSMWISNTAATAMMVPIVQAVLDKVIEINSQNASKATRSNSVPSPEGLPMDDGSSPKESLDQNSAELAIPREDDQKHMESNGANFPALESKERSKLETLLVMRDIIFLGVAYASNIGGTGTLTGTNPNLVLAGFLQIWYPNKNTGVNYASWLAYNVPGMLLATLLGYIWLYILILYYNGWKKDDNSKANKAIQKLLDSKYEELGEVTFHEKMVSFLFGIAILLWIFQKPEIIPGWGTLLEEAVGISISAATPAMLVVFLMFMAPTRPFWKNDSEGPSPGCITWNEFHHNIPWGVIVLIGSGFALAEGGAQSGLSAWIGEQFGALAGLSKEWTLLLFCIFTVLLTEIMSNTAASSILLPIVNNLAVSQRINPIYLLLPVTLCSSYAFMLPVATPPNAIVYEASTTMPISRMMICGSLMNVVCVVVTYLMTSTLGNWMFDFATFPDWANATLVKG